MPSSEVPLLEARSPLRLALPALVLLALGVSAPAHAAQADATPGAAAGNSAGAKAKGSKKEKALLNMLEHVSFPHEDAVTPTLVVVPKIPKTTPATAAAAPGAVAKTTTKTTRGRKGGKTRGGMRTAGMTTAPAATTGLAPAPTDPAEATAATPPEAPAPAPVAPKPAPPPPATELRAHAVSGDTNKSIDDLVAKAYTDAPAAPPAPKAHAETPAGQMDSGEIASAMKPVRSQVKSGCPFGERGVVVVRVEVGNQGQVAAATPEGPLAGKPGAACVVAAVMRAKFPASAGSSFRYPFPVK